MILFWAGLLAATTSLYVLLDGFDLGVGILFAFADEPNRRKMLTAISPVWDGNETWLVVTGTVLFGAFPAAYAALLSAFYLPLVVMLCALILRGVAFEFRYKIARISMVLGSGFRRRIVGRDIHPGHDRRRAGRGPSHEGRPLYRWHLRVAHNPLVPSRPWSTMRLCYFPGTFCRRQIHHSRA